jgi:phosphatidylglycerophosphate synthase
VRASQVPNAISASRILATPVLWVLASGGHRTAFAWLLAVALVSDIVDGFIARHFGFCTRLGAVLDSIADLLLFVVASAGFWMFFPELVAAHRVIICVALVTWVGTTLLGILRYGRLASFHSLLTRICAYVLGIFMIVLFFHGFVPWLFWTAIALMLLSQAEECILLALLAEWTPNARGLYWYLYSRRRHP